MLNPGKVKIQISWDETNDIDHGKSIVACHCLRPLPNRSSQRQTVEHAYQQHIRPAAQVCLRA
jgi:hypothetical protein